MSIVPLESSFPAQPPGARILPFDECAGLIAAQRACDGDARAGAVRQFWLVERTARELARAGAFVKATEYAGKLLALTLAACKDPAIDVSVARAFGRRFVSLAAEIDVKTQADLARRLDEVWPTHGPAESAEALS